MEFQSTPPRGRRGGDFHLPLGPIKFQSTPPRGRRARAPRKSGADRLFQSTPPRGRRGASGADHRAARAVSIHASAREASQGRQRRTGPATRFNPRLRAGGERVQRVNVAVPGGFNPRLRAGGETRSRAASGAIGCFNPRLRAGGELNRVAGNLLANRFNPRLRAGGEAHLDSAIRLPEGVSIHASAREAR